MIRALSTMCALRRPLRRGLTIFALLPLLLLLPPAARAADAASTAASSADKGRLQNPGAGAAPHIPTALFTLGPSPPCSERLQVCFSAHSDQPGVPSLTASKKHIVLINPDIIDITRGSRITADHADAEEIGADFGNSQTVLTGDVHAAMTQGQFSGSTATIRIVNSQIDSIVAQGNPALFLRHSTPADTAASGQPAGAAAALARETVYGHANSITYNLKGNSVELDGNSWLTDGCNEFTSERITYNLMSQTVEAGPAPGTTSRVNGTIRSTHAGANCSTAGGS